MENCIICGDALTELKKLPDNFVQTSITSPPYFGLRNYGVRGQIGLEDTVEDYVTKLVDVFREVKRVLKKDGTLWLNIGDSYCSAPAGNKPSSFMAKSNLSGINSEKYLQTLKSGHATKRDTSKLEGLKPKDLIGIPWQVAFALRSDGWWLRQDIIWAKPNPMPESVEDRCTKSHEYIFLLSKNNKYYFDHEAIKEPATNPNKGKSWQERKDAGEPMRHGLQSAAFHKAGGFLTSDKRNKRSVWTVATKPYKNAHFATFPPDLIEPCILAGSAVGDIVLDPFLGSGTTAFVAKKNERRYVGIELNPEYVKLAEKRIAFNDLTNFFEGVMN